MSAAGSNLWILLQLRARLLLRRAISRYTRSARQAAPFRLGLMILVGLWLVFALLGPLTTVMGLSLTGPHGRQRLAPYLGTSLAFVSLVLFFYAVLSLTLALTTGSDLQLLLLTPVSPYVILADKALSTSLGLSLPLLLGLPGTLAMGRALHLGLCFEATACLLVLLLPVTPVSLAMLLVAVSLRKLPPWRARSVTAVLGVALSGGLFVMIQVLLGEQTRGPAPSVPPALPAELPLTWPGYGLAAVGLGDAGSAALYVAAAVLTAALCFLLAVKVATETLASGTATYTEVQRRERRGGTLQRAVRPPARELQPRNTSEPALSEGGQTKRAGFGTSLATPGWSLVRKDWLTLRRDPQRLAQLAYPLVIVGFYFFRIVSVHVSGADWSDVAAVGLYGTLTLLCVFLAGSIAPGAFNAEGRSIYLLALSPLSYRRLFHAKWASTTIPLLLLIEALVVAGAGLLHLSPLGAAFGALALAALAASMAGLSIVVNLVWPRLTAREARRQASGLAVLISMVGDLLLGGIVFVLLVTTLVLRVDNASVAVATGVGVFVITGGVIAGVEFAGPPLVRRLLTGGPRP